MPDASLASGHGDTVADALEWAPTQKLQLYWCKATSVPGRRERGPSEPTVRSDIPNGDRTDGPSAVVDQLTTAVGHVDTHLDHVRGADDLFGDRLSEPLALEKTGRAGDTDRT